MNKKQQDLIDAAKTGNISDMYELIASGGNPFIFDENNKNSLDYAVQSDPIKTYTLLIELDKICSSTQKGILKHYLALVMQNG